MLSYKVWDPGHVLLVESYSPLLLLQQVLEDALLAEHVAARRARCRGRGLAQAAGSRRAAAGRFEVWVGAGLGLGQAAGSS